HRRPATGNARNRPRGHPRRARSANRRHRLPREPSDPVRLGRRREERQRSTRQEGSKRKLRTWKAHAHAGYGPRPARWTTVGRRARDTRTTVASRARYTIAMCDVAPHAERPPGG